MVWYSTDVGTVWYVVLRYNRVWYNIIGVGVGRV